MQAYILECLDNIGQYTVTQEPTIPLPQKPLMAIYYACFQV